MDESASGTIHDFSAAAGPLPPSVRESVIEACRGWRGQGSLLSLSFTHPTARGLMEETRERLVRLLGLGTGHEVLWMQGGATAQFGIVPACLGRPRGRAVYIDTGHWSRRAAVEAERRLQVRRVDGVALLRSGEGAEAWLRCVGEATACEGADYVHLTSNETADGLHCPAWPESGAPLVVDMSSDFLARPFDSNRIALGYAALQKLIGVAGVTVVIARRDLLLETVPFGLPTVFDYGALARASSRLNTPPLLPIFVLNSVLTWIEAKGGLPVSIGALRRRSERLYGALSRSAAYRLPWPPGLRSPTSLCFEVKAPGGDDAFATHIEHWRLRGLQGHPRCGGWRIANYPGTCEEAVDRLCACLEAFDA